MGRAPCCEKDSVKRGPWTPEEDAKLLACIGQYGTGSWRTLPKKAGLQRCGKSCRLRWTNYLRPDLKHGRFSEQEEQLIVKLHAALGSRWSLIAAQLPGRTDNDVKNYWNTRLKKKLCEMGIDPITHKPISQLLADLAGSMTLPKGSEIAEATLGCFKDDMLNVLMRKRSDNHPLNHSPSPPNSSMSFAPLIPSHPPVSFAPLIPSHPPLITDKSADKHPDYHQQHPLEDHNMSSFNAFRRKSGTPSNYSLGSSPCGPVSGIRSVTGVLARSSNLNQDAQGIFANYSFIKPGSNLSSPPGFASQSSPLSPQFHAFDQDQMPSCMLDMLLDSSTNYEIKEVPDLNLMNEAPRPDPANGAGDLQPGLLKVADDNDNDNVDMALQQHSQTLSTQHHHLYTALLKQQEEARHCNIDSTQQQQSFHGADDQGHHIKASDNSGMGQLGGPRSEWSPASYTNSGSSSSNLSLCNIPPPDQQHISPLDGVLTSDGLLWDLSELGSMVS